MAESPDYQPIDFTPFPANPASYITTHAYGTITANSDNIVYSLTSGNLYAIKTLTVKGTISNKNTSNSGLCSLSLSFTRGLDNGGTPVYVDGVYYDLGIAASGLSYASLSYELACPTPLVVQSGNAGTSNDISLKVEGITSSVSIAYSVVFVMWPLD